MGHKSLPPTPVDSAGFFMCCPVAVHSLWRVALLDGMFWLAVGLVRPFGMGAVWRRLGV